MSGERVVFKYALTEVVSRIRTGADPWVVLIGNQRETLTAWIEQDTEPQNAATIVLEVVGTGIPFAERAPTTTAHHVGSAILGDGAFVFHVYEHRSVA